MIKSVHVIIEGRVQGVGYRVWAARTAEDLGLKGWVRNRTDGSVEAVVEGEPETVDAMLKLCRQGPRSARVSHIEQTLRADSGHFSGFEIRPSV